MFQPNCDVDADIIAEYITSIVQDTELSKDAMCSEISVILSAYLKRLLIIEDVASGQAKANGNLEYSSITHQAVQTASLLWLDSHQGTVNFLYVHNEKCEGCPDNTVFSDVRQWMRDIASATRFWSPRQYSTSKPYDGSLIFHRWILPFLVLLATDL
ncbi:hypothetical protein PHET_11983 [Paragonimus heterotremus]|uniref:Uncharacterized protein n=1 Tax=Paragonimus heterotremus TaxID=100268 RepID=A0A8J4SJV0_9TREM|nr:hypothetical protein PHET_11983 [Paragonimus heterotremus]